MFIKSPHIIHPETTIEQIGNIHCIAFIDPLISPVYLAKTLHSYGLKIIAVYTLSNLSEEEKKLRFHPELFDHVIYVDNINELSTARTAKQLQAWEVTQVFYGYEASLAFADKIASLVCNAYANDLNSVQKRLNKYDMQEALRTASLPCVKQIKVLNKILTASQTTELQTWKFPVIVKPSNGCVSVGIKKCQNIEEIKAFVKADHGMLLHAAAIEEFLVQEMLTGVEYFVDTFSLKGKHRVAGVYVYTKEAHTGAPIYRSIAAVDPKSQEWKNCVDYVLKVLDIVGFKNGFGHTELFLTAEGPCLIEVNPRISGVSGCANKLGEYSFHYSQPQALLDGVLKKTIRKIEKIYAYSELAMLQNWKPRAIKALDLNLIKSLPSYKEHLLLKPAGTVLAMPETLLDTVALIIMSNPNKAQLAKDMKLLQKWEKNNLLF